MGRPISFRDRIAPHLSAVAYTPGDWTAANWREGVAFTSFSIRMTVVVLDVTGRSLLSNGKLSKTSSKIALCGKNCALCQQGQNCGKIAWRKIAIFWGGELAISFSFNLVIHCTSKNVAPGILICPKYRHLSYKNVFTLIIQLYVYMWIFCFIVCDFPAVS